MALKALDNFDAALIDVLHSPDYRVTTVTALSRVERLI